MSIQIEHTYKNIPGWFNMEKKYLYLLKTIRHEIPDSIIFNANHGNIL